MVDANLLLRDCVSTLEVFFWEIAVRIRVEALIWFIDWLKALTSVAAHHSFISEAAMDLQIVVYLHHRCYLTDGVNGY